jgi:hypothetical protein
MIKQLVLVSAVVLGGCASQAPVVPMSVVTLPYYTMDTFKADCAYGETQRRFLEDRIAEYNQYHLTRPYTEQDRTYYTKLKNALWGLRSACGANR